MATYSVLCRLKIIRNVPQSLNNNVLLQALPASLSSVTNPLVLFESDFHTSSRCHVDHRKEKAVVKHLYYKDHEKSLGYAHNPLVELPDYTYQDGKPTEMTIGFKERQEKNYNLAKQVVKLVEEMKFAQDQLVMQKESRVRSEEKRRKSQLKQKGKSL